MRPKGWRLDTKWIAYYERKEEERAKRALLIAKFETEAQAMKMQSQMNRELYGCIRNDRGDPDEGISGEAEANGFSSAESALRRFNYAVRR